MDRIEELLVEMCRAQGQATEYRVQGKNEEMRGAVGRRDHLWKRTAADWRAMVEALEKYEMAEQYADEHGVAAVTTIELLTEAYEAGHTVLARVKGE